ncbi:uncharacterized protein TRIADDRAFT_18979 [Trichoplax adhaerens]|uniref:DNA polymerase n=1 Tax=Trichoplax adhaerens TaxID=10228 RepID=B3RK60_TRIAD|nr:hypothetical protein TRIADDRAFT_18979 [Trichoplax adhaerens]EDV29384.1 hypothetical protein TRIADDRAFT_18979 [Trichoplax adhaerens]|eukprot:XP_002108586.1 hypothetical protein TRIADDRAFT_18979 [Trichoplax adhaerens]
MTENYHFPETVRNRWARPRLNSIDVNKDAIIFQQLDMDYYLGSPVPGMPGAATGPVPIIRMFGVTKEQHTVICHIHGFAPYFYVEVPPTCRQSEMREECQLFQDDLNKTVLNDFKSNKEKVSQAILAVEVVAYCSIYGYHENRQTPFFKITVATPRVLQTTKRLLEIGFSYSSHPVCCYQTYESNIDFEIRFMVDANVVGCNWIELPATKYMIRGDHAPGWNNAQSSLNRTSRCQIEADIAWDQFISYPAEDEWQAVAPLRLLSFDIMCSTSRGTPDPDKDSVIQIAAVVIRQGDYEPFIKNIFTTQSSANIVGCQLHTFSKEKEMLKAWHEFFLEVDPDIITGYNVVNSSLPYLLNRSKALGIEKFSHLGRITNEKTQISSNTFQSRAYGKRENKVMNISGRVQFDLLHALLRDYKLRSYSLNAVTFHFLKEQKELLQPSVIADLLRGNDRSRRRLAIYCLKNASLPIKLLDKLMCIINYMEMARVTGVPLGCLLTRGQQIKVVSQLLRYAKEEKMLMPAHKAEAGDDYTGAIVIEPVRGYYDCPIATLDFSSLYPSIMQAHNLCYTTLLQHHHLSNLSPDDYIKTPSGNYFVKKNLRAGILPKILQNLLSARKKAKFDLKNEKDPFKRKVLDGRQLALKISANSVYGFTGAQVGKLPCLEVSQSVTAFGRQMIEKSRQLVEERYTIKNGYKFDAQVIYGDTDSVMVKFGLDTVEESMELGKEAANYISSHFPSPIKLEFEKVYFPYLLINKKRYAGLYFTKADTYDKVDCKGIETVRRDNCPLVANLINACLQKLLVDRNPDSAIKHVQQTISDLLCNRIDISQLIITKELTRSDDEYAGKQAHVELAAKMRKRDPSSCPTLGDRVPYVIITGARGAAAYTRSEDPVYALENSIAIDTTYYLENQLSKPLLRIFEPILGENKAESILLKGDHTLTKTVVTSSLGRLSAFVKKRETCMGCKAVLDDNSAVCKHCRHRESEIFQREMNHLSEHENRFAKLWTQCQRCQGSLCEEVLCTSRDCPVFYMRKKVQKDLKEQEKLITRFGDLAW